NTRVNLVLAIACAGLLVSLRIWFVASARSQPFRQTATLGLAFGLPLLAAAAGLMAYNQARFGSPFDFGYEYLITGPTIPEDPSRRTSTDYVIPNTFQYLIRPPEIQAEFPYIVVPWIKNDMWPNILRLPRDYFYTEPVASLLITVPLIGFGLLAAGRKGWLWLNGFAQPDRIPAGDRGLLNWLFVVLAGNIAFTVPVLLMFTQNTYRYLADLTPPAVLLSVLVFAGLQTAPSGPERSFWRICWTLGAFLAPIFGILIAVTGYQNAFERLNPGLYNRLVALFPPW
ncbi:MAG TPA: hypothetical protein VMN57_11830, partial [Anaerolineales bacterium]|nr:hypothetical protein [Anaerolineales bacterium]